MQGLSPHYIGLFFERHGRDAWEMLAGVLLCVTGTETMFAAMGHFSRESIAVRWGGRRGLRCGVQGTWVRRRGYMARLLGLCEVAVLMELMEGWMGCAGWTG